MGARIEARDGRFPPVHDHTARRCSGIEYELPVASAQVKSCVLLAGLVTDGTTIVEPVPTRDHTERMLLRAGAAVEREHAGRGRATGRRSATPTSSSSTTIEVPGDLSSAPRS